MLRKSFQRRREENDQMSTAGPVEVCTPPQCSTAQNDSRKLADTERQTSALQCSYGQETENYSNLEVFDNLNYVMALEGELQF